MAWHGMVWLPSVNKTKSINYRKYTSIDTHYRDHKVHYAPYGHQWK